MYIYIYIHTYIHIHIHQIYVYVIIHIYIHIYIYIYIHTCIHTYIHILIYCFGQADEPATLSQRRRKLLSQLRRADSMRTNYLCLSVRPSVCPLFVSLCLCFRSAQVRAYDDRAQCRNIGIPYNRAYALSSYALTCVALIVCLLVCLFVYNSIMVR